MTLCIDASSLQGLPGKAPTLYRRMGAAGEPAVHLLSRLLSFEPRHRASAGEALSHEYFSEADPGRAGGRQPARPGATAVKSLVFWFCVLFRVNFPVFAGVSHVQLLFRR